MDLEFRYVLGKVLDTQDRPTLRLVSHHCVLHLNLIKNNFQYLYSKLMWKLHLTYNHGIIILKQYIISIHKAIKSQTQTQIRNPSIHLTCEHPIIHLKARQQPKHGSKAINIDVATSKSYHESKTSHQHHTHVSKED